MTRVIIELEFNNRKNNYEVNDAEVYNYLQELIDNDCLSYTKKEVTDDANWRYERSHSWKRNGIC